MHWIYLLGVVVVVIALFALSGAQPEEGRAVASTRMMTAARIVLGLLLLVLSVAVVRAWLVA